MTERNEVIEKIKQLIKEKKVVHYSEIMITFNRGGTWARERLREACLELNCSYIQGRCICD